MPPLGQCPEVKVAALQQAIEIMEQTGDIPAYDQSTGQIQAQAQASLPQNARRTSG